jgi:hypothetical protein
MRGRRRRRPRRARVLRICGVPGLLTFAAGFIMLPSPHDGPDRWHECASEMHALAAAVRDPSVKLLASRVAKDLDWFAECLALGEGRSWSPAEVSPGQPQRRGSDNMK